MLKLFRRRKGKEDQNGKIDVSLRNDKTGAEADREVQVAVCAVWTRMAQADGRVYPEEFARLNSVMQSIFALSPSDVAELMEVVEMLRSKEHGALQLYDILLSRYSRAQCKSILEFARQVGAADGPLNTHELRFEELLVERLHL